MRSRARRHLAEAGRGGPARAFAACVLLLLFMATSARAVDSGRRISQYAHTAWRIQDGIFSATEACTTQPSTLSVVGESREMHPIVRDEVYRIGYEAIRNACAHAGASQLTVELRYEQELVVRVRDNGRGIEAAIAAEGKPGHFGLQGMRERAARIGGRLSLVSAPNCGTEVTLVVPGSVVYQRENAVPSSWIKTIFGR